MSATNDGGPAFPICASTGDPRDGVYCQEGVSTRDYFAAAALGKASGGGPRTAEEIARRAYYIADAMLAERRKGEKV